MEKEKYRMEIHCPCCKIKILAKVYDDGYTELQNECNHFRWTKLKGLVFKTDQEIQKEYEGFKAQEAVYVSQFSQYIAP